MTKIRNKMFSRIILTLIFAGYGGGAVFAQMAGVPASRPAKAAAANADMSRMVGSMVQSLTASGAEVPDMSSHIMESVSGQLMDAPLSDAEKAASVKSAIQGDLVVEDKVPAVNQTDAAPIDKRTGRYPPRLKMDFAEFPLRVWDTPAAAANEEESDFGIETIEETALRIKTRLELPELTFRVKGRTITVIGTVHNVRQRELVEAMLHFEPGIDAIHNKLNVK